MSTTTITDATSREFTRLAAQIDALQTKSELFRELFRERGPGRYAGATVYAVKSHQVRAYWREGWVAVRVRKTRSKKLKK